ncbi:WXG100 family type VII secretion target [Micromonospora auratinigra]|uniref:Proteins of 100 residues with WXG n=1 Tax=Micromonospora auratinigra TaxID=261654 RepID=A0A1A8ZZL8_9ACTN|nr:WXG100 family type VII secretion target [Micromonospora auratinigra]SBT49336.1 Proteins of 100 residues with WXG [Micromonospora auratinigra]
MTDTSLVAGVTSTREVWTGASLAESFESLVDAIRSEGWVDDLLAGAAFGVEVAASVMDPFSALLANGLGWAMEYFEPLRQLLDDLAGMPDVIASHAATWNNIAGELQSMATDLKSYVDGDTPHWQGRAADAYHGLMKHNVEAVNGLAGISAAMSVATQAAGNLVTFTRELVRDLIADLVARVVVWAVEAIFVVTIPVIAAQIAAAVVKWAGRILTYTVALVTSLTNLAKLING